MANQGDLIKLSNLPTGFTYHSTIKNVDSNNDSKLWIYFCCPVFCVRMYTRSGNRGYMTVRKYNPSTNRFNGALADGATVWSTGSSGNSKVHAYFYHNCWTEHVSSDSSFWVKGDDGTQHLYRLGFEKGGKGDLDIDFWDCASANGGGARGAHIGDLIQYVQFNNGSFYYTTGFRTTDTDWTSQDQEVINMARPSQYRGRLITTADIPRMGYWGDQYF